MLDPRLVWTRAPTALAAPTFVYYTPRVRLQFLPFLVVVLGCSPTREFTDGGEPTGGTGSGGLNGKGSGGGGTQGSCTGCLIDDECHEDGDRNPENPCEVCDVEDAASWTAEDGDSCDDGLFCTEKDTCKGGLCLGSLLECEDGVSCNGVSSCDEDADRCSEGESACSGALCDLDTDSCVTTCSGCVISSQCVPDGRADPNNACLVCNSAISADDYSPSPGKACGTGPETCSGQDTCDDRGACQQNHSDEGTTCGDTERAPCDEPDSCDGSGKCVTNAIADGMTCDDGLYCTTESKCESGECIAADTVACESNHSCDDQVQACVCTGCQIGALCIGDGETDPGNSCMVCSPALKKDGYSPDVGADCGAGATECSSQDTCDGNGACRPNHVADGEDCTGGLCEAGSCAPFENPFDCIVPTPPTVVYPTDVFGGAGQPPVGQGGTIVDGRYVPIRLDLFSTSGAVTVRTFEFRNGFVQVGSQPFLSTGGGVIPQIEFAGTYSTTGNQLAFSVERCDPTYNIDVPTFSYTTSANGMVTIETLTGGAAVVTSYARE